MGVTCDFSDVFRGIDAMEEHLRNPAPVLKHWAKGYREAVRQILDQGGIGSIPYADTTMKRMDSTGTSQVSSLGKIRSDRIKKFVKAGKRHQAKLEAQGWSPDWQAKQDELDQRHANYVKAEERAARTEARRLRLKGEVADLRAGLSASTARATEFYKWEKARAKLEGANARKIGKRKSETHSHPLQNMGKTIRSKVYGDSDHVKVYSAANIVGLAHDEGAGSSDKKHGVTPARPFIKTPDFDQQVSRLAQMFEHDLVEAFDGS